MKKQLRVTLNGDDAIAFGKAKAEMERALNARLSDAQFAAMLIRRAIS